MAAAGVVAIVIMVLIGCIPTTCFLVPRFPPIPAAWLRQGSQYPGHGRELVRCPAPSAGSVLRLSVSSQDSSVPVFTPRQEVEAGCVLVAAPDEIDHFSRHAVVIVLSHGPQGSRGVV